MSLRVAVALTAALACPVAAATAANTPTATDDREPPSLRLSTDSATAEGLLSSYCYGRKCAIIDPAYCPPLGCQQALAARAGGAVFINTRWRARSVTVAIAGKRLLSYRATSRRWAVALPATARDNNVVTLRVRYDNRIIGYWSVRLSPVSAVPGS